MTADSRTVDFVRYLLSKRTVDDRALNRNVWDILAGEIRSREPGLPFRVLEVGAGVGTMIERFREHGHLAGASYLLLDSDVSLIDVARSRFAGVQDVEIQFEVADALEFATSCPADRRWGLVVAHAFLDLTDVSESVPLLLDLVESGGLGYFTINYDGTSTFWPEFDPTLDQQIESLYNESMHRPGSTGAPASGSRSGREIFNALKAAGAEILAVGSSDWVVYANAGRYPSDEAYFLECILGFIELELADHPALDQSQFEAWLDTRRSQIDSGDLVYIAHQLDYLFKNTGQRV